ncbi:MAG: helicase-associated domain-containing protein [Candidatus Hydrogenedentes bacterium]|nr:helicase-associated domain-containing protein [Candidatus Hydrogenedentota bacterium]
MRHGASLVAVLEGMSRPAFRIAKELSQNSRAGLTVRFLSKKLDLPEEEIEYLVEINYRLFFTDLTKIRLVAEGYAAIKRIAEGLENFGDIPSLQRRIRGLDPRDFSLLEEKLALDHPLAKKDFAEAFVNRVYPHPEAVVEYVVTREFSPAARELFDLVWNAKDGVLPVARMRQLHGGSEFEVEQGLAELLRGLALFEMFRFDGEERLVRVAGVLAEIRQWREAAVSRRSGKFDLKPIRSALRQMDSRGLDFSDRLCRIVAALAARPARLRGDGDLFREDRRRLSEVYPEDADPPLNTLTWVAQGVGWLGRVDNTLSVGRLDDILKMDRLSRHRVLFEWLVGNRNETASRRLLTGLLDELKPGSWYPVMDFIRFAMRTTEQSEQPVLKSMGGHWQYLSPSASPNAELNLARVLEEMYLWLGVVDRAADNDTALFRISELGRALLTGQGLEKLRSAFPERTAEIIVQPNFDIVVPLQDVDPLLTVALDQFAERSSSGQATVYHLSKESYTQAVQQGHDGDAFVEFLLAHNRSHPRGTLPANVMTTLDDWRGGMKRVRLRVLQVLESDDPLVIADLLHRKRFTKCLETVDPRKLVTISKISKSDLVKNLEKEGFVVG